MPFQTITDEETGEERKVYVLPDKETPQKIETEKESLENITFNFNRSVGA